MKRKQVTINIAKIRELMAEKNMTQTALAKISGVSRGYLVNLLQKDSAKVRWSTAEKLARALQLPVQELDMKGVEKEYLALVMKQHKNLEFGGLGIVYTGSSIPFDRGFIPLSVKENKSDEDYPAAIRDLGRMKAISSPKLPLLTVAKALQRAQRCCLLGDPGCGKTTVLRHIARTYASKSQATHSYPAKPSIPVFIRLAAWGEQLRENNDVGVVEAALSQIAMSDNIIAQRLGKWLAEQIKKQKIVLLLDGLDEVVEPEIQSLLLEKIRSFVNAHPDARVVVTSRVVGFETTNLGSYFTVFKIQPLPVETSSDFVKEWFAFRHGHGSEKSCSECESRTEHLTKRIAANPRISAIAGNPLMLTILALLNEAGAVLPQRRWDLYQKISEAFLFSWEESKRGALSGTIDHGVKLDNREVLWLLESVAIEMQRNDWTLVPRWWLSRHFNSFLRNSLGCEPDEARNEAEALIWSLQQRAGLLVERGPERYGFSHLAFQEYFAASAILKEPDPVKVLRPYFYHPRWREVVCLAASQMDWRKLPRLLRSILDDPDPTGRFMHRGLLLTLACLKDQPTVPDQNLLSQIANQALEAANIQYFEVPFNVVKGFLDLRDTRLKDYGVKTADAMVKKASDVLNVNDWSNLLLTRIVLEDPEKLIHELKQCSIKEKNFHIGSEDNSKNNTNHMLKPIRAISFPPDDPLGHFTMPERTPKTTDFEWVKAVSIQLSNDELEAVRAHCADELREFVKNFSAARDALKTALKSEKEVSVLIQIARALAPVSERHEVRELLKGRLKGDSDEEVRGACARALEFSAAKHKSTKQLLVSSLLSVEPPHVRAGCALGLSRVAMKDNDVRELLLENMRDKSEDERVRIACLQALESLLPDIPGAIEFLKVAIESSPVSKFTQNAAVILGSYAMTGRVQWKDLPIDKIEHVIMNIEEPFSPALTMLRGLIDGREIRKLGVPREEMIKRALSQFSDIIKIMFIFGSSAKDTQGLESDIDLLIVGDVSLKELIPGLRKAEQGLGRQVNAVVYKEDEWQKRIREGNPFVKNISKEEKIFITGGPDELAGMAG